MPDTESQHASGAALLLPGGAVLVAGGCSTEGFNCTATEILAPRLSPSPPRWTPGPPLVTPRSACAAVALAGGVYLFGGLDHGGARGGVATNSAEVLRRGASRWEAAPPLPEPRTGVRGASLGDGRALLAGGFSGGGTPHFRYYNTTWVFSSRTHAYTPGPPLPCAAGMAPQCALVNMAVQACGSSVWVLGGSGEGPAYPSTWRLAEGAAAFRSGPALPAATTWAGSACVPLGGAGGFRLYSVGGFDGNFDPTAAVFALDLDAAGAPVGGWTTAAPLPAPRGQVAATAAAGAVVAVGGIGSPSSFYSATSLRADHHS